MTDLETIKPLLAQLSAREQRIVAMRFLDNRTQQEIADAVGISQMHVSRLLTRILGRLRDELLSD